MQIFIMIMQDLRSKLSSIIVRQTPTLTHPSSQHLSFRHACSSRALPLPVRQLVTVLLLVCFPMGPLGLLVAGFTLVLKSCWNYESCVSFSVGEETDTRTCSLVKEFKLCFYSYTKELRFWLGSTPKQENSKERLGCSPVVKSPLF